MNNKLWLFVFLAWLMSLISAAGSLFFSEVMKYPPCSLCWYQRLCMFPLVIVLLAGLFPLQKNVVRFSLPLSLLGTALSFYHSLLYYNVVPASLAPCSAGASCLTHFFEWGPLSIPLLSFLSFLIISILLILAGKGQSDEK